MIDERISYKALKEIHPDVLHARMGETPREAARWVRAAALNGIKSAQVAWGQMLLDGQGVERDPEAALRWFAIAAEAGSLDGVNMVGRCHEFGWGCTLDMAEAARCYLSAAERGHAWAQFNLATLLLQADEFAADPSPALAWYVRSARRGNAKAMTMVGRFLEYGWGRRARPQAARRWYRMAALGGDFRGQFDYARTRFEDGFVAEAIIWFSRSIEAAVPDFCRLAEPGLRKAGHPALDAVADRALDRVREAEVHAAAQVRAELVRAEATRKAKPRRRLAVSWLRRRRT
ncbi:tetratricopeptide repeat protein [Xanthobacter autotrophicus]|uniref:tetratricopeptide repeat protein n=1 Tax=Xanthobacter autotrophicus TaxID=280 RepID=UPI00372A9980